MSRIKRPADKKATKGATKRLLKTIFSSYPGLSALVIVCIVFFAFAQVANSYFIGNILIDVFLSPSIFVVDPITNVPIVNDLGNNILNADPISTFNSIRYFGLSFYNVIAVMISIMALGVICGYFYNALMAHIAQGVQLKIRDDLFAHMEDLPVSYFDLHTHGDIMSIYTNDVDALREMMARCLPMVVQAAFSMTMCFIMMMVTDFYLTIVVISFAVLMLFLTRFFSSRSGKYFVKQQEELGKTDGYIEEMISGQKVIKVFNHEKKNIEDFREKNENLYLYTSRANKYANTLMPAVNQLGNIQYALLALLGGIFMIASTTGYSFLHITGHLYTFGIISSFLMFSKSFIQPIGQVSSQLNSITMALAGASRIYGIIDEQKEVDDGYVLLVNAKEDENGNPVECKEKTGKWAWKHPHSDGSITYTWMKGKVNIDDVDFGYSQDKIVLHNINVYAYPGQKVAFVGPTGAGKTTITNLLNRFYDIADGKIRYDDININKIKKADLRRALGMVFQDTKLFAGTVKENIRYGNLDASDEEVVKAAKLAKADVFIRQLPNGYDTLLTNAGASLSQGQKQLLAIARAAIADPPVLILDEATSSIDSRTEKLVQEGMDAIMKGRTVFVIAHRLSTIKNSDVIMVLDNGRIIERGNHESLLALKGKYYQLYTGNAIEE